MVNIAHSSLIGDYNAENILLQFVLAVTLVYLQQI